MRKNTKKKKLSKAEFQLVESKKAVLTSIANLKETGATALNPPNFTVKQHLSSSRQLVDELRNELLGGRNITLQAPAGSGKTYLALRILAPLLTESDYTVVFVCPFKTQRDAIAEDDIAHVFVYDPNSKFQSLENQESTVVCTYNKIALTVKGLAALNAANEKKTILIVDESQFLTKHRSFRPRAITDIERVMRFSGIYSTMFISATPNTALDEYLNFRTVKVEREKNPVVNLNIRIIQQLNTDLLNEVVFQLEQGKKVFLMLNNYKELKVLRSVLIKRKIIAADEVCIYSGETEKEASEAMFYIAENKRFPEQLKLALSTEVLKQAIDIRNKDYELIYTAKTLLDTDYRDLVQFFNRLRDNIEDQIPINCTVFLNASFPLKSEDSKALSELSILKWFRKISAKTSNQTNQFSQGGDGTTTASITLPSKVYAPKFSTIYDYEGNKHYSVFAAAQEAELYRLRIQTVKDWMHGIIMFSPANTIRFSLVECRAISIDSTVLALAAKDAKEAEGIIQKDSIKGLISDLKVNKLGVLGFAKACSSDVYAMGKLNVLGVDVEPDNYRNGDSRYYMKALVRYVSAYNLGFYTDKQLLSFLETELLPKKEKQGIKGLTQSIDTQKLAVSLGVLLANETKIPSEVNDLIFSGNKLFRYSLNLLHSVFAELRAFALEPSAKIKTKLEAKITANEIKLKYDKAHASRYNKAISKAKGELKNLERDAAVMASLSDVYDYINKNHVIKASNFTDKDLSLILRYFTNIRSAKNHTDKANFEIRASLKVSFANYANALELTQNEVNAIIGRVFVDAIEVQEKRLFNASEGEDLKAANAVAKAIKHIIKNTFNIDYYSSIEISNNGANCAPVPISL